MFKVIAVFILGQQTTNQIHIHFAGNILNLTYRSVPQIRPPSRISPPCIFSAKSCRGIFIPRISPSPPPSFLHSQVQGIRGGMSAPERSQHPQNCSTRSQVFTTQLSTVKLSTTNADRLQHRWTRQLLRGSALLPRPSTLKLTSLLLASEASLRLAFYARRRLALRAQPPLPSLVETPTQSGLRGGMQCKNEVSIHRTARHFSIEGGCNRERKCRIPRIRPPCALY